MRFSNGWWEKVVVLEKNGVILKFSHFTHTVGQKSIGAKQTFKHLKKKTV